MSVRTRWMALVVAGTVLCPLRVMATDVPLRWVIDGPTSEELNTALARQPDPATQRSFMMAIFPFCKDDQVRGQIVTDMRRLDPAAVEPLLVNGLRASHDVVFRDDCAKLLARCGGALSIDALLACADRDPVGMYVSGCMVSPSTARFAAYLALSDIGRRHPDLCSRIAAGIERLRPAENESDTIARDATLFNVTGDLKHIRSRLETLTNANPKIRSRAWSALSFVRTTRALPPVMACLRGPNPELRRFAASLLGVMGATDAIPELVIVAENSHLDLKSRACAIESLGDLRAKAATPVLRRIRAGKDRELIHPAALALSLITGRLDILLPPGSRLDALRYQYVSAHSRSLP